MVKKKPPLPGPSGDNSGDPLVIGILVGVGLGLSLIACIVKMVIKHYCNKKRRVENQKTIQVKERLN